MKEKLERLLFEFKTNLNLMNDRHEVMEFKAKFLGKNSEVAEILKNLRFLSTEKKKELGPFANRVKEELNQLAAKKIERIECGELERQLEENKIDITNKKRFWCDRGMTAGHHPVTMVQREIEEIFLSMGFEILDGPHVEDEYHNFEALNIPKDHPARDMQDTFWFQMPDSQKGKDFKRNLLRTHTSTIQVRGLKSKKPPFRFIAPGKVFRCERTDASHEMVFHQLEGMMVGKDISVANLIYFMKIVLRQIFKKDVEVRLRPGYFPFVEPGFELDIACLICRGGGCSVCKQIGWVELLPCGMVHPNVLSFGGIDPREYNAFAFGLGLDRLVMMKYAIDDIRLLHGADLRFSSQFKAY